MRYENSFRNISIFVISFHLLCIGWCIWTGTTPPVKKTQEKLIVKTVSLKNKEVAKVSKPAKEPEPIAMAEPPPPPPPPPPPEPEPEPEPEPVPVPAPKPVAKPKPKPEPKKEVAKPKEKPKPKPVVKATPKKAPTEEKKPVAKKNPPKDTTPKVSKEDLKKQELIAKAQAMFTKAGSKPSKNSSLIALGTISKLEIDSPALMTDKERRYQDILAAHLKDRLCFPEYGEVKIKLTLANSGKVLKVDVVSAKSCENRNYALKTLPGILFPTFDSFIKEDQYTFSITLKND